MVENSKNVCKKLKRLINDIADKTGILKDTISDTITQYMDVEENTLEFTMNNEQGLTLSPISDSKQSQSAPATEPEYALTGGGNGGDIPMVYAVATTTPIETISIQSTIIPSIYEENYTTSISAIPSAPEQDQLEHSTNASTTVSGAELDRHRYPLVNRNTRDNNNVGASTSERNTRLRRNYPQ